MWEQGITQGMLVIGVLCRVSLRGAVSAAGSQAGRLKVIVWRSPDSALTVSLQCDFHIWIEMNLTGAAQSKSTLFSMKTSCRFSDSLAPALHASGHTICAVLHADPPAAYCALNIWFFTKKNQNQNVGANSFSG